MAPEELPAGVDALECDEATRLLIVATPATEELMCLLETAPCIASDPPWHLGLLKISPIYFAVSREIDQTIKIKENPKMIEETYIQPLSLTAAATCREDSGLPVDQTPRRSSLLAYALHLDSLLLPHCRQPLRGARTERRTERFREGTERRTECGCGCVERDIKSSLGGGGPHQSATRDCHVCGTRLTSLRSETHHKRQVKSMAP